MESRCAALRRDPIDAERGGCCDVGELSELVVLLYASAGGLDVYPPSYD